MGAGVLARAPSVAPGEADVIFGGLDGRGSLVEGPLCRAGRGGRDFGGLDGRGGLGGRGTL